MRGRKGRYRKGVAVDGPLKGQKLMTAYDRITVPVVIGYIDAQPYFDTGLYHWDGEAWYYDGPEPATQHAA